MSATPRTAMSPSLRTQRLKLDAFTAADAVELHALLADPDTHTIGSGPFTAFEQTERWIANRVTAQRDHGLCWYALRCSETGRLIGNCGMLKGRTGFEEPEIGYLIQASRRGSGYATEAAVAVLQEGHAAGLRRVWASIRPHNIASLRIATRLGLHLDHSDSDDRGELLFYVIDLHARRPGRQQHLTENGPEPTAGDRQLPTCLGSRSWIVRRPALAASPRVGRVAPRWPRRPALAASPRAGRVAPRWPRCRRRLRCPCRPCWSRPCRSRCSCRRCWPRR